MDSISPFKLAICVSVLGLSVTTSAFADTPPPPANAGTLTCSIPADAEAQAKLPEGATALSCEYEALSGPGARFDGIIKRISSDKEVEPKVILSWAVLAPTPDVELKDLEGQYMGTLNSTSSSPDGTVAGLRGGANDTIELRPVSEPLSPSSDAAISVLQLALHSTKA